MWATSGGGRNEVTLESDRVTCLESMGVSVYVSLCVCVCGCVSERERETETRAHALEQEHTALAMLREGWGQL